MKLATRLGMSGALAGLIALVIGYAVEDGGAYSFAEWIAKPVTSLFSSARAYGWSWSWEYSSLVWAAVGAAIGILFSMLLTKRQRDFEEPNAFESSEAMLPAKQARSSNPKAELAMPQAPPTTRQRPKQKHSTQTSPGFAQGGFGKAMAYTVGVFGLFVTINSARLIAFEPAYDIAYEVGRMLPGPVLITASLRAIFRGQRRVIDWFLAAVTALVAGLFLAGAAYTFTLRAGIIAVVVVAVVAVIIAPCLVVAVRLVRQPYFPPPVRLGGAGL